MTTPEPVSPAPEGPRALLSPDGKLIAWRTGARHFQWRATDGYDRMPEDVADWLPLVPAVSPAPDTEALRQQVARMLIDVAHDFGHARSVMVDTAVAADALLKLVAEREAGLRADLGQTRAERDKFADLHRGEARTHDETIASLNAARAEVERLRGIETASAGLVELVKQCGGWPDTGLRSHFEQLQELRADVERLTAALARVSGARPIPDDEAAVEKLARWLFRTNGRRQGEPLYGDGAASPERQEKRWTTWLEDEERARLREMARHVLADLGAASTTDPAPAAADGRPRWVQRGLHHHRCAVRSGAADCTCGVEDAAPQAPVEPAATPEDVCNGSGVVPDWDAPAEEWPVRGEMDTTGEPPGRPCEGCDNCTGRPAAKRIFDKLIAGASVVNGVPQTPAAREDIAPPEWAGHNVQVSASVVYEGSATAVCEEPGCGALTGGQAQAVDDWADTHRADTLRPANPTPEEGQ